MEALLDLLDLVVRQVDAVIRDQDPRRTRQVHELLRQPLQRTKGSGLGGRAVTVPRGKYACGRTLTSGRVILWLPVAEHQPEGHVPWASPPMLVGGPQGRQR